MCVSGHLVCVCVCLCGYGWICEVMKCTCVFVGVCEGTDCVYEGMKSAQAEISLCTVC